MKRACSACHAVAWSKFIQPKAQPPNRSRAIRDIFTVDHGMCTLFLFLSRQRLTHEISQSNTVDIPDSLKASLRKFRFAKRSSGSSALIVKVNKQTLAMEEVEQFDSISLEDLAEGMSCPFI